VIKDKILPIEQVVYVPSTNKEQKPVPSQEVAKRVAEVKRFLSAKYGGFTSVKSEGGYAMENKGHDKIVQEGIIKVTSFATRQAYHQNKPKLISQLRRWGDKWGQESMGLEVEGDLEYVYSTKTKAKPRVPITVRQMTERHSPSWIDKETKVWS
jgi:hypothetical protein